MKQVHGILMRWPQRSWAILPTLSNTCRRTWNLFLTLLMRDQIAKGMR